MYSLSTMTLPMTEEYAKLANCKPCQTVEEAQKKELFVLPPLVDQWEVQKRMTMFEPLIQRFHREVEKFVMFSLSNNTQDQGEHMIRKGLFLIQQLGIADWESQAASLLKASVANADADVQTSAASVASGKATKGNKKTTQKPEVKPTTTVRYTDLLDQARAPALANLARTSAPVVSITPPQMQQASPMQQSNDAVPQARLSIVPQRSNFSQLSQPTVANKPQPGARNVMTSQSPMPRAHRPTVQHRQEIARFCQMAENTQQSSQWQQSHMGSPQQQLQKQQITGSTTPQTFTSQQFKQQMYHMQPQKTGNGSQAVGPIQLQVQRQPSPIKQQAYPMQQQMVENPQQMSTLAQQQSQRQTSPMKQQTVGSTKQIGATGEQQDHCQPSPNKQQMNGNPQRMGGSQQQIATSQPQQAQSPPPGHIQRQVWAWIRKFRNSESALAPTPQQQKVIDAAQKLHTQKTNLDQIPVRNPRQQLQYAYFQTQFNGAFLALCRSLLPTHRGNQQAMGSTTPTATPAMINNNQPPGLSTPTAAHAMSAANQCPLGFSTPNVTPAMNAVNQRSIRSSMPNATPPKKRSAPSDFETQPSTKKKQILVGHRANGVKVFVEDMGNGQVRVGGGQVVSMEVVRREAKVQGMTLAIPDSSESFNTPELWEALSSHGWDKTADQLKRAAKEGAGAFTQLNKDDEKDVDFDALLKKVETDGASELDVPELTFDDESDAIRRRRYQWKM